MTLPTGEAPVLRLPFQVRPRSGEGGRSFIVRLAEANHLKPGYLRKFLAEPPRHTGRPSWERLAAVTGHDPVQLRRILETTKCPECGAPMVPSTSFGVKARTCSTNCRMNQRRRMAAHYRRTAPCHVCGKPMDYRVGQRRYLCSSDCRRFAFECRRRGQPLPQRGERRSGEEPSEIVDALTDVCPACGGYLQQPRKRRACSRRCTRRIRRWLRTPIPAPTLCSQCGEPVFACADGRPRTVCSDSYCQLQVNDAERDAEREQAIAEALAQGTRTCRGCGGHYRPAWPNKWCSNACLDEHANRCRDSQECPGCGASTANLPRGTNKTRQWCSHACQQRGYRWRAEFRERARHPPRRLSYHAREILSRNDYRGDLEYQPNWSRSTETKDESPRPGDPATIKAQGNRNFPDRLADRA